MHLLSSYQGKLKLIQESTPHITRPDKTICNSSVMVGGVTMMFQNAWCHIKLALSQANIVTLVKLTGSHVEVFPHDTKNNLFNRQAYKKKCHCLRVI